MAEMLHEVLAKNGMSTIADATASLPIIVESFELNALKKYATLSDLPLIQLAHYYADTYDWDEIA